MTAISPTASPPTARRRVAAIVQRREKRLKCEFLRDCRCEDGGNALLFEVIREGDGRKHLIKLVIVPTTDEDDPAGKTVLRELGKKMQGPARCPAAVAG